MRVRRGERGRRGGWEEETKSRGEEESGRGSGPYLLTGVEAIASRCHSLARLSLNSAGSTIFDEDSVVTSHSITDASLLALHHHNAKTLVLAHLLPSISSPSSAPPPDWEQEYLDLSWCRGITDEVMIHSPPRPLLMLSSSVSLELSSHCILSA
eukprot:539191-Hanusia_phi.AAC.1